MIFITFEIQPITSVGHVTPVGHVTFRGLVRIELVSIENIICKKQLRVVVWGKKIKLLRIWSIIRLMIGWRGRVWIIRLHKILELDFFRCGRWTRREMNRMFRFEGCVNKPRVGKIKITIIKNQKILKNLNFTPDLSFFAE